MTRPSRADRTTVADRTIGVRLPPPLFEALAMLVDERNASLRAQGIGTRETPSSYVRSLVEREVSTKLGSLTATSPASAKATPPTKTPPSRFARIQRDAVKVSPAKKAPR